MDKRNPKQQVHHDANRLVPEMQGRLYWPCFTTSGSRADMDKDETNFIYNYDRSANLGEGKPSSSSSWWQENEKLRE
jgi:hypothetical protein